jgi:hypothetical protein
MRKYRLRLLTGIWWIIRRNRKPDLFIEMRRIDLLSTFSGTVQREDMPMHSFSLCDFIVSLRHSSTSTSALLASVVLPSSQRVFQAAERLGCG